MPFFPLNKKRLEEILLEHDLAKFGDSVVNFIYNMAVYQAQHKLQGVKVWDRCLAVACKNSPLKDYLTSQKKPGDIADAVEAFIGYLVIENRAIIEDMISILTRYLNINFTTFSDEQNQCSEAFSKLLVQLCSLKNIQYKNS